MNLSGKKILVGITGGIAAYKVCSLVRELKKSGAQVKVAMTASAEKFVTKTTLEALSGEPVAANLFDPIPTKNIQHIDIVKWADCFVVAPATANIIAKTANGIADDLLSTLILSYPGSVIFAPAMNDEMWKNTATQKNLGIVNENGHQIIPPEVGELACDTVGVGRMAEPETIFDTIAQKLGHGGDLKEKKMLLTIGGTQEKIDPVRYIGNRSSGKMGRALALESARRGAEVTIILGTHSVEMPDGFKTINALTANAMAKSVAENLDDTDILIMAAAVADYTPIQQSEKKLKKKSASMTVTLEKTVDILSESAKSKKDRIHVGFALENENGLENAINKLKNKKLDLIVLNEFNNLDSGFDVDTNVVTIIGCNGEDVEKLPLMSKDEAAEKILNKISKLL